MQDYSLYICPNNIKESILKDLNDKGFNLHIKFITKQDLLKNVYFDYDYRAIDYLRNKLDCHFDNAKEILDNLYNINNGTDKMNQLVDIYTDLCNQNLLMFNKYFYMTFKGYTVYVLGYSKEDIEIKYALDKLNIEYEYQEREETINKHKVITFDNMDDEVLYVFNEIGSLVEKGTSLNNIYFYNVPSEYEHLIRKFSSYYKIPVEGITSIHLYESPIYKEFRSLLLELGYKDAYNTLKDDVKYDSLSVLDKLSSLLIKLSILKKDKEDLLPILDYVAQNTKLRNITYKETVKMCDDHSIITDKDHVFLLGFSLGSYPHISRDIDYLTDEEKKLINRNTSTILNSIAYNSLKRFINSTKNLTITYKKKLDKKEFYFSLLKEDLDIEEEKGDISSKRYSIDYAKFETANYKDLYYKYNAVSEYIDEFKNDLDYKIFSHKYKGIEKNEDGELTLSYTQINEYYKCSFMFFVKRVLKANIFEESFELKFGSLCHKILEDSLTKDVRLDDYEDEINKNFTTNKELFFTRLLLPQMIDVLKKVKDLHNNTQYKKILGEQEFKYKLDDNTSITGFADKLMIDEQENKAMIIDYKTGKDTFDMKKLKYGLNLQLPLYSTLLKGDHPELEVSGLFLQNILVDKNDLEDDEIDNIYKLTGIYTKDLYTFKRMDTLVGNEFDENGKTINKSKFITGGGVTQKNTVSGGCETKVFNDAIELAHQKAIEAAQNIRESKFDINPKAEQLLLDRLPCKYCECYDICFRKLSDVVIIKDKKGDDE